MKKAIAILFVTFVTLVSTFALDLDIASLERRAGGGLTYNSYSVKTDGDNSSEGGFGLYGFYDMQYAVFSLGYYKIGGDLDVGFLDISAMGKYPIAMDLFTIFPMAGFCYNRALTGIPDGADAGDMSNLGIKLGVGLDYDIKDNIFIRPTALYALYLKNSVQKDADMSVSGLQIGVAAGFKL